MPFIGGHGMSEDNRLRTVAAPDTIAGTRLFRETRSEDDAAIRAYGARLLSIFEAWPVPSERDLGLDPRTLTLSPSAVRQWHELYDCVETQQAPDGPYHAVRDFAGKIAEHAARIAGVLTIVADFHAREIDDASMASGVVLAQWCLDKAVRLHGAVQVDPKLARARKLLEWLSEREGSEVRVRELMQFGPNATRFKEEADAAIRILMAHGWVEEVSRRPWIIRVLASPPCER